MSPSAKCCVAVYRVPVTIALVVAVGGREGSTALARGEALSEGEGRALALARGEALPSGAERDGVAE